MSGKKQISFKITEILNKKLEDYIEDHDFASNSDAINHILEIFFAQDDLDARVEQKYNELLKSKSTEDLIKDIIGEYLSEKIKK